MQTGILGSSNSMLGNIRLGDAPVSTLPVAQLTNLFVDYAAIYGANARVTKEYVQVLRTGSRSAQVTKEYAQILRTGARNARISQYAVSVLRSAAGTIVKSVSQTLGFLQ